MIRLFFIKNKLKNKNLMSNNDEKILEKYKKIAQKEKHDCRNDKPLTGSTDDPVLWPVLAAVHL